MTVQLFRQDSTAEKVGAVGSSMRVLATGADTDDAYEVVVVETDATGDLAPHRHPWEEWYYVLEGTLEVQVGRQRKCAGPGTFVTLPARCVHGYRVTSDRVRFIHASQGGGAVAAFRDLEAAMPEALATGEVDRVLEVLDRHGIELVAPAPAANTGGPHDGTHSGKGER
jgi:quercetin dioxygenase-like cupin family protein